LLIGGAAAASMAVASCTTVTEGDPIVNAGDAPLYRTSIALSLSQSAASSSERQASLTTQAIHTACETLSSTSSDAIDAVNEYVGAFNQGSGNIESTEGPAIRALSQSAEAVSGSITDAIPQRLKDAFAAWINGAQETARAIANHAGPEDFNRTINRINNARSQALKLCGSTYR
jgi:ABC-type transporter Mla subunit MlaD